MFSNISTKYRLLHMVLVALLLLTVFLTYSRAIEYSLVWDDNVLTVATVYSDPDLKRILTSPANGFEYLPVRDLSLVLDYQNYGGWYGGFHRTNIVLFLVAVLLAYTFYIQLLSVSARDQKELEKSYLLAFLFTMIFSLHPLHVESVAFITARNALLALVFTLAGSIAVIAENRTGSRKVYWVGLVCLVLALFSKATSIFLPLLFILLDMYLDKSLRPGAAIKKYLPHLVVTGMIFVLHLYIASGGAIHQPISVSGVAGKLYNIVFIPEFYLYKFLWPFNLLVDYPVNEYLRHRVILSVASIVVVGTGFLVYFRGRKNRDTGWFVLLAYLVALLPVMNLLPTTPQVADRYSQIPLLFLTPLVLLILSRQLDTKVFSVFALVAGVGLGFLSYKQVQVWESDASLFGYTLSANPGSVKSMHNLGNSLWKKGDKKAALKYFEDASKIVPKDMAYQYFLGRYAEEQGDIVLARQHLLAATKLEGDFLYLAYLKLGFIYERLGEYGKARQALEKSIELAGVSPRDEANKNSARLLLERINKITG